jgi:hypothetical protein
VSHVSGVVLLWKTRPGVGICTLRNVRLCRFAADDLRQCTYATPRRCRLNYEDHCVIRRREPAAARYGMLKRTTGDVRPWDVSDCPVDVVNAWLVVYLSGRVTGSSTVPVRCRASQCAGGIGEGPWPTRTIHCDRLNPIPGPRHHPDGVRTMVINGLCGQPKIVQWSPAAASRCRLVGRIRRRGRRSDRGPVRPA